MGTDITPPAPAYKQTTLGGGCAVERRNVPWPFDPNETIPRPQTWRNRRRIAARYVAANWIVFAIHGAAFVGWFALARVLVEVL